ncbi:hypothetical protein Tco_0319352 [Tanacetum coccineum]
MGEVNGLHRQCAKHQMQLINYIEQIHHSFVKVPKDILVVNAKHLQTKVDRTSADLHELVELVSQLVKLMDTSTPFTNATVEGEKDFKKFKRLANLKVKREKSEKKLRRLTPEQLRAQKEELAEIEAKRVQHMNKMRYEYTHCINFRDNPLPITKFNYRVSKASKIATMRITRNNQPLNYEIFDNFILKMLGLTKWLELHSLASKSQNATNDQLLKSLKAKFKWVATTTDKLRLPPPPQLTKFELPLAQKKRKRRVKVMKEVIQQLIKIDPEYAQQVYEELIYEIEVRSAL